VGGKGRATTVIYPGLFNAFFTVLHNILVSKLERKRLDGWNTPWIRTWLDGCTQRIVVNGSMSKCRITLRLVLGPEWFNIFVSDMDSGTEETLSKFADDTKLCGMVNMLEGRDAVWRDLDRLERWAHATLMKFNKAEWKVLHMSWGDTKHRYRLGGEQIESIPERRTWGCWLMRNST